LDTVKSVNVPRAEGVRWNSQEKVPTFEVLAASLTDVVDGELAAE